MAKTRNPYRDSALQLWLKSGGKISLKEIAQQINVSEGTIRSWKNRDKWTIDEGVALQRKNCNVANKSATLQKNDTKSKRKAGAQPGNRNAASPHGFGNQNAVDNDGGAPLRNTNAVRTGEHQTIWMDYLTEDERAYYDGIDMDKDVQTNITLRNLTYRENIMLKRIFELQEGVDNIETRTVKERCNQTIPMPVRDKVTGEIQTKSATVSKMMITEITEKKNSMLGEILRIEEALTRVQDKKAKLLQIKHKLDLDRERLELARRRVEIMALQSGDMNEDLDTGATDSYLDALRGQAPRVWSDEK